MRTDVVLRILDACRTLDRHAATLYAKLGERFSGAPGALWRRLESDQAVLARYWDALEAVLRDGGAPHLFDWPFSVEDEMHARVEQVEARVGLPANSLDQAFSQALSVELARLHPAVAGLLHHGREMGGLIGLDSPVDRISGRLEELVAGMSTLAPASLDRELLGQSLLELGRELQREAARGGTDPLTGLLNRRGVLASAEVLAHLARRQGTRLAVLVAGVDHLKEVNDRHGDDAGDAVLRRVAEVLEHGLRRSDVVGRTGGDEFTVVALTPSVEPDVDVERLAEKLRQAVAGAPWPDAPVTVSVGAAHGTLGGEAARDLNELLVAADENLYRAKHRGRNVVVVGEKP